VRKLKVLIVDDEPLIRRGIRTGLEDIVDLEVVGECGNGAEAIAAIQSNSIDLVLLDVQLPDCLGIDVVEQVGPERMPLVIFVTAYDEYAVKAFQLRALDYVLKPFDEERLQESITRARERLATGDQSALVQQLHSLVNSRKTKPARLVIKNNEAFEFVDVAHIDWAESANNYVQLHCGTKTYLMSSTLSKLEETLSPHGFVRVHRCYLVNTACITTVHTMIHGTYVVQLHNGVRISTGRQYKDAIRSLVCA
jgi:two-component system, LytTR family, response regulator